MSILINRETAVVVQGITGKYGQGQVKRMTDYGTKIVAGVTPGRAGEEVFGIPIYDTVFEAIAKHPEINTGIIYVPPLSIKDATEEAIDAGIKVGMIAAEGVPLHDTMKLRTRAREKGAWIVGPNTLGLISPGECMVGSLAADYATKGRVGLITRGGTIAVELIRMMSQNNIGQSTCIASGGDKVIFRNPAEYLEEFEKDDSTEAVVLNAEIGGNKETQSAEVIRRMKKKVFAYVLGRSAPKGKRMGHIGAIIGSDEEGWENKVGILREAGAIIVDTPWILIDELKKLGLDKK